MEDYIKAIVWPREPVAEKDVVNHRYVIVGMLVTTKPIPEFDQHIKSHGVLVEGPAQGQLAHAIRQVYHISPVDHPLGDATEVLLNLDNI